MADFKRYKINPESITNFFKDNDPLIDSAPAIGVEIDRVMSNIRQEEEKYFMSQCLAVNVDPDALLLTAKKNAELQERLKTIREETRTKTIEEMIRFLTLMITPCTMNNEGETK